MRFAILIPTYNEVNNIQLLLRQLAQKKQEHPKIFLSVYVIDDNSPDKTAQIVEDLAPSLITTSFRIYTIRRAKREGLGRAYIDGFCYVLEDKTLDYVIQMDGDLSHNPNDISHFFEAAHRGVELMVASRYITGGSIPDWPWYRRLLSRGGNAYARLLLGSRISDYTGGFNMYSTPLLRKIDFKTIRMTGYSFLIALKFQAVRHAKKIESFPIVFIDRVAGQSKMPINTAFNSFLLVFNLWRKK